MGGREVAVSACLEKGEVCMGIKNGGRTFFNSRYRHFVSGNPGSPGLEGGS